MLLTDVDIFRIHIQYWVIAFGAVFLLWGRIRNCTSHV
jgi:hypothetical protein